MPPTTSRDFLKVAGQHAMPVELAKRLRRFDWATDLRYETGRCDTGETIGFLKTANAIYRNGRRGDIMNLLTFSPTEVARGDSSFPGSRLNAEFEDPSPSML